MPEQTQPSGEAPQATQEAPKDSQAPATAQEGSGQPQAAQATGEATQEATTEVKKLRSEATNLRRRLKEQEDELARLQEATQTEQERAISKAVREARKEWDAEHRATLLPERVQARAASKVADPGDALALMDLTNLDPDDPDGIDAAVDALLEAKPRDGFEAHLVVLYPADSTHIDPCRYMENHIMERIASRLRRR